MNVNLAEGQPTASRCLSCVSHIYQFDSVSRLTAISLEAHESLYLESMPFEVVGDQCYMHRIQSRYLFELNEWKKKILIAVCGLLFEGYPAEITRFEKGRGFIGVKIASRFRKRRVLQFRSAAREDKETSAFANSVAKSNRGDVAEGARRSSAFETRTLRLGGAYLSLRQLIPVRICLRKVRCSPGL